MPGERISLFSLRRPDGSEIKCEELRSWTCMKRSDLLEYTPESLLHPSALRRGRSFSHFIRQQGRAVAAVFTNGETEYGDIFIGCDGGTSRVRDELFGRLPPTTVLYKEIVGVTHNRELWQRYGHTFVKFQHDQHGLSFGMIPTGTNDFVWFMQYDPCRGDVRDGDPETIRKFCTRSLNGFPAEVTGILSGNDFNRTYVWNTRDFESAAACLSSGVMLSWSAMPHIRPSPFPAPAPQMLSSAPGHPVRGTGELDQSRSGIPAVLYATRTGGRRTYSVGERAQDRFSGTPASPEPHPARATYSIRETGPPRPAHPKNISQIFHRPHMLHLLDHPKLKPSSE